MCSGRVHSVLRVCISELWTVVSVIYNLYPMHYGNETFVVLVLNNKNTGKYNKTKANSCCEFIYVTRHHQTSHLSQNVITEKMTNNHGNPQLVEIDINVHMVTKLYI